MNLRFLFNVETHRNINIWRSKELRDILSVQSQKLIGRKIYCSIHCGLPNIINFTVWFLLRNEIPNPDADLKQWIHWYTDHLNQNHLASCFLNIQIAELTPDLPSQNPLEGRGMVFAFFCELSKRFSMHNTVWKPPF